MLHLDRFFQSCLYCLHSGVCLHLDGEHRLHLYGPTVRVWDSPKLTAIF